jgi:hypothetical protein
MVDRSENFAAIEVCAEGLSFFSNQANLVLYLTLSLARIDPQIERLNCSTRHADGSRMCRTHGLCAPEFTKTSGS